MKSVIFPTYKYTNHYHDEFLIYLYISSIPKSDGGYRCPTDHAVLIQGLMFLVNRYFFVEDHRYFIFRRDYMRDGPAQYTPLIVNRRGFPPGSRFVDN